MIQRFVKKIIKVGNSAAVMLPASFVKEGNLKIGDEVIVETMTRYQTAMIKPKTASYKNSITPEFKEWLDCFTKKHDRLLKKLAGTP
jgi:antitoxin component of MazEF toxin-antitoxin module